MLSKTDLQMNERAAREAVQAAYMEYNLRYHDYVRNDIIVAINYREPSYRKRLYVMDLATGKIIRSHHCAHGVNSSKSTNRAYANKFSNRVMSKQTSLGAMKTGKVYRGAYGKSLKLHGLEPGVNNNVYKRFIVIHPSKYVSDPYILRNGRCGQSWGCPSIDYAISSSLIDLIKEGTLVYAYY